MVDAHKASIGNIRHTPAHLRFRIRHDTAIDRLTLLVDAPLRRSLASVLFLRVSGRIPDRRVGCPAAISLPGISKSRARRLPIRGSPPTRCPARPFAQGLGRRSAAATSSTFTTAVSMWQIICAAAGDLRSVACKLQALYWNLVKRSGCSKLVRESYRHVHR
jgi:hypothetical protein